MKKLICMLLAAAAVLALAGCTKKENSDKKSVVCSAFVAYDPVRTLCEGCSGIQAVLVSGSADPHSFEPGVKELSVIYSSDLFVYIGGESESWCEDAIKSGGLRAVAISDLTDGVAEHEGIEPEDGEEPGGRDEHVWTSPERMPQIAAALAQHLCEIADDADGERIRANLADYVAALEDLNEKYHTALDDKENRTLVVADRFPFSYLAEDFGLECFAAFSGCSAESEASFETVVRLADAMREHSVKYVIVTETSDGTLAQTVIDNVGANGDIGVLTLDSLQSLTDPQGTHYCDVMEKNLETLKTALS